MSTPDQNEKNYPPLGQQQEGEKPEHNQNGGQVNNDNAAEEFAEDSEESFTSFPSYTSTPPSQRKANTAADESGVDPHPQGPLRPNNKSPSKGGRNNHQNFHKPSDIRDAKKTGKKKTKRMDKANLLPDVQQKEEHRHDQNEDQDGAGGHGGGIAA